MLAGRQARGPERLQARTGWSGESRADWATGWFGEEALVRGAELEECRKSCEWGQVGAKGGSVGWVAQAGGLGSRGRCMPEGGGCGQGRGCPGGVCAEWVVAAGFEKRAVVAWGRSQEVRGVGGGVIQG